MSGSAASVMMIYGDVYKRQVWSRDELERVAVLCKKHGVYLEEEEPVEPVSMAGTLSSFSRTDDGDVSDQKPSVLTITEMCIRDRLQQKTARL